jgi:cell division transport system permease protein
VRALGHALGEAAGSLLRRRGSSLLAILTITVAVFVLGVFLLLTLNAQRLVGRWTDAAEMSVFLADDVTAEQREAIRAMLAGTASVAATEFVSSDEAVKRFGRLFPELAQAAASLGPQALPASFDVRLRSSDGAVAPDIEPLALALRRMPGVSDVRYDRQWVDRLQLVVRAVRVAGGVLAAVLVLAAALTVASVVRLALHARRQEVEIMHLVGAPLAFIRGPFVIEGVLQGGLGAIVAVALLAALHAAARARIDAAAASFPGLGAAMPTFLPFAWVAGLVAGGMLVGCIGGLIAARSAGVERDR